MSERWVNAVITFRLPLDVAEDAPPAEKREAALEAYERYFPEPPPHIDAAETVGYEDVEDGEPIQK